MEKILEINHLEKHFLLHILNSKVLHALNDINLSIFKGEIIGLVGKSGSGKSTLMKCIYRTYLPSSGEMFYYSNQFGKIDITNATDYQMLALRKHEITYCSQFLSVIPRLSAIDVVAAALHGRNNSYDKTPVELARNFLDRMGLASELWDAYPSTFSGGEQQRVNVARAIISNPQLLLIDEPTASLDKKSKDVVIEMILELKQKGTSVLVISHDKYTLDHMCDRLLELENGKILEPNPNTY